MQNGFNRVIGLVIMSQDTVAEEKKRSPFCIYAFKLYNGVSSCGIPCYILLF